jgi:uncharacterized membrane protein
VSTDAAARPTTRQDRLLPIDWARGLVMILMAVDHASGTFNRGRVVPGSRNLTGGVTSFPTDQFFLRWATHICPVTFVSLAGVAMVLATGRKEARGVPAREIDRFLVSRGVVIVLLDVLWLNLFSLYKEFHLDVLAAIGTGMVLIAALRRLPRPALALAAVALFLTPEYGSALGLPKGVANLLFEGGRVSPRWFLNYPVLPWAGVMALGWLFGEAVLGRDATTDRLGRVAARTLLPGAIAFAIVRAANGFGNAHAPRLDGGLQQWLNVSKNPPSAAFLALELAILGLFFVGFAWAARRGARFGVLTVFGQTALFFYVLHFPLLRLAANVTGLRRQLGIPGALVAAALLCLAMYPLCRWYARYKAGHDNALTRYV